MSNLAKIEMAARRATLWQSVDDETGLDIPGDQTEMPWDEVLDCDLVDDCEPTTRAFLETCSPDVVLALVARIRELEQMLADERREAHILARRLYEP